jgi:hypothetical protein
VKANSLCVVSSDVLALGFSNAHTTGRAHVVLGTTRTHIVAAAVTVDPFSRASFHRIIHVKCRDNRHTASWCSPGCRNR